MNTTDKVSHSILDLRAKSASPFARHSAVPSPSCLAGAWAGAGEVCVTWIQQPQLEVGLTFHSRGRVTGHVGDAILLNGRLHSWARFDVKHLRLSTTYSVSGELSGPLLTSDEIHRSFAILTLHKDDSVLRGELKTAASISVRHDRPIQTARRICMDRV